MSAIASVPSGFPINPAAAGPGASLTAESLLADLLAGASPATLAAQFPNLLENLLAAEAKDEPETKDKKKEDPPGGAPALSVDVSAALALAPVPVPVPIAPPRGGETSAPPKKGPGGEVQPFGTAQVPTESAAAAAVEKGVPCSAEPPIPEIRADAAPAVGVTPQDPSGRAPEKPTPLSDDKPAVAPPADAASVVKLPESGPSVKIQKESPKPPEPVTGWQNQAAAPSLPSPRREFDSQSFGEATEIAPEDAAAPPAGRQTEQTEAALSRPEPMTRTPDAPPLETSAAPATETQAASERGIKTLAFAARLIPIEKAPPAPGAGRPEPARPANAPGPSAVPETAVSKPAPDTGQSNAAAPAGTARKTRALPDGAADHEPKRADHAAAAQPAVRAESTLTASAPVRVAEGAPLRTDRATGTAEPHHVEVPLPSEPALPASPARDIRLQVGGERHVDVRVTERGGEVQVAVRTPDSRLAGELRDELPALSARLEQSGFRAETWHPDTLRVEHAVRSSEPSSPGTLSDGRQTGQQGSRRDDDAPPRRAPMLNTERGADAPPKEFSWIFSSLR